MKKIVLYFIELIFIIGIIFSLYKIVNWYNDNKTNDQIVDKISKTIKIDKKTKKVDFEKLKKINSDVIGYIKVYDTNIEYPVVKHTDNNFYLNHNFEKKSNVAGWIFLNYQNNLNDKNVVLFGHNMKNGSMFGSLKNTLKKDWQNKTDYHIIKFITEEKEYTYKIFSTYQIEVEDYYIKTSFSNDDYSKFINTIKKRSNYEYNVDVNENDNILTLSTCSGNKYRVVVHAKKEKEEE